MPKIIPSARRSRALQSKTVAAHNHSTIHHDSLLPHNQQKSRSQISLFDGIPQSTLLETPRKVSFEEGHCSSSSFSSSSDSLSTCWTANGHHASPSMSTSSDDVTSTPATDNTRSCGLKRSRATLRRKPPSVCLVDMVDTEDDEGISAVTSESRSPRSSPMNAVASPGSPWGHFVDILVPLDEESPTTTTTVSYDYDAYSLEPSDVPPPLFSLRSIEKNKPFVHKRRRRQEYLPLLSGSSSTVLTPHPYRLQARKHGGVRERSPPDSTDTSSSLWRNPFELPAAAVANYNHEQQQQQQQQEVETALQHLTV